MDEGTTLPAPDDEEYGQDNFNNFSEDGYSSMDGTESYLDSRSDYSANAYEPSKRDDLATARAKILE